MNQFVTSDWLVKEALTALNRSINRQYDANFVPDAALPTFDHVPTETGREAAKRLWGAAFGEGKG